MTLQAKGILPLRTTTNEDATIAGAFLEPLPADHQVIATAAIPPDPELRSLDPADRLTFVRPPRIGITRFDSRSDAKLQQVMVDHEVALERERAIWEYADRHQGESLDVLTSIARHDADPAVRWSTLWAIQKFTGMESLEVLGTFLEDDHPEVRTWAGLLVREIMGETPAAAVERRPAKFDKSNPFDQTLPLTIAGYARVSLPGGGWVQATLSPQWFEAILGRVMACTRAETFTTDLVIEKRVKAYHADGSNHYEIYPFRGHSQRLSANIHAHYYQSETRHTFYPSGKVEDTSEDPIDGVIVNIQRGALTEMARVDDGRSVVASVRGRYIGAAYVNLSRVIANGMEIGPGEVQLSSFHHPVAGKLTNTHLFGTFKGKLADLDGDGYLDVNTERCHGTIAGAHDEDLDGVPDRDPFDFFS